MLTLDITLVTGNATDLLTLDMFETLEVTNLGALKALVVYTPGALDTVLDITEDDNLVDDNIVTG